MTPYILYVKPLLLPPTICVLADNHAPKDDLTFFLGGAKLISATTLTLEFMSRDKNKTVDENKKYFMDFYSQVQVSHGGFFLAELPVFTDKKTTLFRMNSELNYNYKDNKYSITCSAWCCWEYADGVIDTAPPAITILGSNPISVTLDNTYTDAGATATDDKDGDVTANIATVNNVDTATLGDYTVTYTVKDSSDNIATATRIVHIVDVQMYRYIRTGQNDSDVENGTNHVVEVFSKNHNGDLNVPNRAVVLNVDLEEQGHDTTLIVDGIVNLDDAVGDAKDVFRWLLIDYGQDIDIKTISVWRYFGDARSYHDTTIQVSTDNVNWTTLQDSNVTGEYVETEDGFTVDLDNL